MKTRTHYIAHKFFVPLLLVMVIQLIGCATPNTYPASDHYDGKNFHNPIKIPKWTAGQIASHIQAGHRGGKWPDHVHNAQFKQCDISKNNDSALTLTYVNHSTVLIRIGGTTILTDPVWSQRVGPFRKFGPARIREPGISFESLPKIDLILLSHDHYDHMDIPTLKRLVKRDNPTIMAPLGNKHFLQSQGIHAVLELDWWDEQQFNEETRVVLTPAQHTSGRFPWLNKSTLWGGFLVLDERSETSIYFAGDTAYQTHFLDIKDRYGAVDIALLPIGAYKPRKLHQSVHMDPLDAIRAHEDLEASYSAGIHHGTFQLSAESYEEPFRELNQRLLERGLTAEHFLSNTEGRTLAFKETDGQIQLTDQCEIQITSNTRIDLR